MFIALRIFIFCLLIQLLHSFRTPKHNLLAYFKSRDSVFLTNPNNHTTSYGIYVAGRITTIDVPKSLANLSTIINWKVVNVNRDLLMFVHDKKPRMLVQQKKIEDMKYSGQLNGSIISLGDNEALHVATIFNSNLTKPSATWNYLELLHFDVYSGRVTITDSLKWFKDDDWKFIVEWKLADFIHMDDKLYLLIQRSIFRNATSNTTNEMSIIRLCLDKGNEFISSAVEIHYTKPEFHNNTITDATLVFITQPNNNLIESIQPSERYSMVIQLQAPDGNFTYVRYYINNFISLFDQAGQECASGSSAVNLFGYHLRSEVGKCEKTAYKSCTRNKNTFPSVRYNGDSAMVWDSPFTNTQPVDSIPTINSFSIPYPIYDDSVDIQVKSIAKCIKCVLALRNGPPDCSISGQEFDFNFHQHAYINHLPPGELYVSESTDQSIFFDLVPCYKFKSCIPCIMYGLNFGCVWSNSECTYDGQPKSAKSQMFNLCVKIVSISPLVFNNTSPETLVVQLDKSLDLTNSQESLAIKAGFFNYCTNFTMDKTFIYCSLKIVASGEFRIHLNIENGRYADASIVSALSEEIVTVNFVEIEQADSFPILIALFLSSLFSSLLVIIYHKCDMEQFKSYFFTKKSKLLQLTRKFPKTKSEKQIKVLIKKFIPRKNKSFGGNFSTHFS
uniref:Sema domain-containing protein n=1 Tax=Tetranychus urticae TaxID=32264 RepID=T1KEJ0_TETUR